MSYCVDWSTGALSLLVITSRLNCRV